MNARAMKIFGAVFAFLIVAGGAAGFLVVKSQRTAYARETVALIPKAEESYAAGRFGEAALTAGEALVRFEAHPAWFAPDDEKKVREIDRFMIGQVSLWGRVEAAARKTEGDPAKARAELLALLEEARRDEPRALPLVSRTKPQVEAAIAAERAKVEAAVGPKIPNARSAYEAGTWDVLLAKLDEIRALLATLPDATFQEVSKKYEADLKAIDALAAPVAAMKSIRAGKEEGFVKADRLRDLIPALADIKGRDKPLHRDLRAAIAELDPETRKPVAGVKLKKEGAAHIAEAFTKGTDLERIGDLEDTSVLEFQNSAHRYSIKVLNPPPQLVIEVDRVRVSVPVQIVEDREALSLQTAADLAQALRAARPASLFADEPWQVRADAPAPCAVQIRGKEASVLIGGRVYEGSATEYESRPAVNAFLEAARSLEQAVRASTVVADEIKGPVAAFLKAAHTRAPPGDHLDGKFCRESVHEGYVEAQLPQIDDTVAARLKEYRRTYGEVVKLRPRFEVRSADGAFATLLVNYENDVLWRVSDPLAKTTTFSSPPRDHMGSNLTVVSVFSGLHQEFPKDVEPLEVRMSNGVVGTVSRWTAASGKLDFDAGRWAKAVTLGDGIPEHFGTGDWQVPPHALKVDGRGQARELILPTGALAVGSFSAKRDAQEKFLQRCSEVFKSPGEYHLFYRYFVQYVLDSPVTTATSLIGSGAHCGDAHQDAYQTLDRRLNGRFLADCDDLAELYWTILRRQDRPAFVLGVPGHATCGVAEKSGDGWTFFCVDTGPARQMKGADLDDILEKVLRSYDRDRSMSFDPRQMRFLFRFAGEQTRSDYYLDSRILRDPQYADLMIRVQEYWHFGFYALGIETMSKVLESDRMPANCQEIAGLYTRVGLWNDALKWTETGIKGLDAKDAFTGLSDTMRVIQCHREMKRQEEAVRILKTVAQQIEEVVKKDPSVEDRYRRLKFQVATEFAELELPWDGWSFVRDEVEHLLESGVAAESLMSMVTEIYSKMRDAQRNGTALTEAQNKQMAGVAEMLQKHHATTLFERDDSNLDLMRKYAQLYGYYAAVEGGRKAASELIKAEYPAADKTRAAGASPAEDWAWIRLSPYSYAVAAAKALDKDDKNAGGPKEAIAVIRAMEAALPEIRRRGSLGTAEFSVLDLRLMRACLEMDEKAVRSVFAEMKRQGWGELYENLGRTLGATAAYMALGDFEKVFKIFCEYEVPRRHYYGVVYSASAAEARPHALAASRICIERFPKDPDMAREHALLLKLAK